MGAILSFADPITDVFAFVLICTTSTKTGRSTMCCQNKQYKCFREVVAMLTLEIYLELQSLIRSYVSKKTFWIAI